MNVKYVETLQVLWSRAELLWLNITLESEYSRSETRQHKPERAIDVCKIIYVVTSLNLS